MKIDGKIKKVLLLNPPVTFKKGEASTNRIGVSIPLGIAYIASFLREKGYDIKLVDCLGEGFLAPTDMGERVRYGLSDQAVHKAGTYVCTEGPRFETPAEIEMFRRLGCDVVGMTVAPEAMLARELEMCYAAVSFVSNMAAGIQQRLTAHEVAKVAKQKILVIQQILRETTKHLPKNRKCPCAHALEDARFRG